MNTKLALATLLVSFALSCSVSEGQLLDRMLSKAGCSACGTTSGCGGGLLSGGCGAAESCGCGLGIGDKLKGRLAGGCGCASAPVADCGCSAPAPVADCGCEAAPAPAPVADCGCEAAPVMEASCGCESAAPAAASCGCGGTKLLQNLRARYDGGGLGSRLPGASSCGCSAPAPAPVADCGCSAPAPAPVADCGCSAPAPAPIASCGCDAPAAPARGGCKLLDSLKAKLSAVGSGGGCGCSAAPVMSACGCGSAPAPMVTPSIAAPSSCGCRAPAPVADCGCSAPAPAPVSSCGCGEAAPAVSDCGCGGGVASGILASRPQLSLLDRLRGNRVPRDREGRLLGGSHNDGCNPPCPQTDTGCGCGAAVPAPAPMVEAGCSSCSSCSSCGGGEILSAPFAGEMIYSDSSVSSEAVVTEEEAPTVSEPVVPAVPAEASDVIEQALPKVEAGDTPAVDPNAFIAPKGPATS